MIKRFAALLICCLSLTGCTHFLSNVVYIKEEINKIENTTKTNNSDTRKLTKVKVISFIDGDTFHIEINGVDEKVRLLYVNTPEKKDMGYQEATDYTNKLIKDNNQVIYLEQDQGNRDKYDRLLRVVYFNENDSFKNSLNYKLYENGYAKTLFIDPNVKYKDEF